MNQPLRRTVRNHASVFVVGVAVGLAAISLGGIAGCAKKGSSLPTAENPQPNLENDVEVRIRDLREMVGRFEEQTRGLPGRDEAEHRQIMEAAFSTLSQILPTLAGPNPSGTFRLQLRQVNGAREQLATGNKALAIEPVESAGLRATVAALTTVAQDAFYNRSEVIDALDRVRARLRQLEREHGAMHRLVVRDVVRETVTVLRMMGDVYGERLTSPSGTIADPPVTQPDPGTTLPTTNP